MDGSAKGWYFPDMRRASRPAATDAGPRPIAFHRTKYGRELLVDAAYISRLPKFDRTRTPHTLDFYDILLVTRGRGTFALDADVYRVAPGTVFFSRPGEVRRWDVRGLDGACLFFTADFLSEAFYDPRFVDQFACFRAGRPSAALELRARERREFLAQFADMEREIAASPTDAAQVLRALVYHLLVLLNRWYVRRYGVAADAGLPAVVERFRGLVEREFTRVHSVSAYARLIGVSPRHLSFRCRGALGESAGEVVRERIMLEARRLLLYTDLPVSRIGMRLGFDDPAYFARFFRRAAGESPTRFRAQRALADRAP
jgi:AraC family transcriptional activator of pobA